MPNTGNLFPSTAETLARGTGTAWGAPSNAVSDDTTEARCGPSGASGALGSAYLVCRNFGLAFAAGDTVSGITIRIEASEHSGGTEVLNAQLQNDVGALIGTPKTITLSGTAKTVYTLGGIADLWGATLTETIVNSPNFGVRFWFTTTHDVRVDFVTAAIEYALAPVVPGGPFPPGVFPGPIFPGPIFPGAGGADVADSLTSVAATIAVETILSATHKTLFGVEFSAAVGFVTTANNVMASLSGVDATAAVGSVLTARTRTLAGTTATAAVGSVVKSEGVSLTGVVVNVGTGTSGSSGAGSAWGTSWGQSWGTSWGTGTPTGSGSSWGSSWGDSWGTSWGAGSVSGIGNVVANNQTTIPGVQSTANVETVRIFGIQTLNGVTLQAQVGYIAADPNRVGSLTGVAVTAEVGSLQGPLVGSEVTVSVGTVVATVAFGLTGVEVTATNETVSAGGALFLIGVDVQNDLQSLLIIPTVNLSSITVTVAVGTLVVPTQLGAVTGVDFEADVETCVSEIAVALSGVDVTANVDTPTTTADREQALTGVEVSVDVGWLTAQNDILDILTGVDISAAVGTVRALRIKTLPSVTLSAAVGTIVAVPHRTATLSGVAVTVSVNQLQRDGIPLTGVAAGAAVESLGQPLLIRGLNALQVTVNVGHTPKEGDVILDTVGVLVGAGVVGILGVIPPVPTGTYRHSGPTPIRKRAVKDLETLEREMALMEE